MKARKVVVQMELITNAPIKNLRNKEWWSLEDLSIEGQDDLEIEIDQIQVNVVKM